MLHYGARFKNQAFRKKLSRNILVSPIKKGICEKIWTEGKLNKQFLTEYTYYPSIARCCRS
jgi:hypothetical protein